MSQSRYDVLAVGNAIVDVLSPATDTFLESQGIPKGAMNLIDACIDRRVKRAVALSTDKASSPANLYGATKLASDKLLVAGNAYSGASETRFGVVRYGNVMGSRGSVIPFFASIAAKGVLPITDPRMTRFMITLEQGVELVWHAIEDMVGGEI